MRQEEENKKRRDETEVVLLSIGDIIDNRQEGRRRFVEKKHKQVGDA